MTLRDILLILGHPDAGHAVRSIRLAQLDFPLQHSQQEWEHGTLPACLQSAQDDIRWASHVVLFFPLWLGDMPALLHETLIGMVGNFKPGDGERWLAKLRQLGGKAA